ncbi:hypothetical protein HKD37_10G028436 [Glycine soja]
MCSVEDCLEEQASQGSSIPNGCQDLLIAAIGRLEHPDRIQSQGLALPPEPEVGPLVARVSTKGSCVDPSLTDPDTGDFNKCGLYIEENPSRLVALGRVYEGSTTVHNIPLLHGHGKLVLRRLKMQRLPFLYSLTRPDNYLKGVINSALKGLDDTPQPKSKAGARWIIVKCNRQKGSTECDYYVMHWMSTIILGTFRNNWETYFNDVRP